MDSLIREYERLAALGDASAERRLIELKKRSGRLDIYIVEEGHFEYSLILDIFFSLEKAVELIEEKCKAYRRYQSKKEVKWERRRLDSFHKKAELAYIWRPVDSDPYSDPGIK
jgi:hypothetical protein